MSPRSNRSAPQRPSSAHAQKSHRFPSAMQVRNSAHARKSRRPMPSGAYAYKPTFSASSAAFSALVRCFSSPAHRVLGFFRRVFKSHAHRAQRSAQTSHVQVARLDAFGQFHAHTCRTHKSHALTPLDSFMRTAKNVAPNSRTPPVPREMPCAPRPAQRTHVARLKTA